MNLTTEKIWLDYHNELKKFILSKVKDIAISNDIMQDVFVKVHLNIGELKDEEKLKQWIYQITRNTITDYFRKKKYNIDVDKVDLVEEILEQKDTWRFAKCLSLFIKNLPEKYREAIELVEIKKLSQLQLAEKLNISYSGAKSRVQRGRDLLKELFSKCCKISTDKYGNVVSAKSNCSSCQV